MVLGYDDDDYDYNIDYDWRTPRRRYTPQGERPRNRHAREWDMLGAAPAIRERAIQARTDAGERRWRELERTGRRDRRFRRDVELALATDMEDVFGNRMRGLELEDEW